MWFPLKLLLVILQLLLFPLNLVVLLIFAIYTGLNILSAKIFQNFVYSIPGPSQVFLGDRIWTEPFSSIVSAVEVQTENGIGLTRDGMVEVYERIYNMRDDNGERCYRELGYYPVRYYGCGYWAECDDFEIRQQVDYLDKDLVGEPITSIVEKLMRQPFEEGRPLWNILIYRNFEGDVNRSLFFIRFHHMLCDGMSLVKLCYLMFGAKHLPANFTKPKASMQRYDQMAKSWVAKVSVLLYTLTFGFVDYFDQFLLTHDKNGINYDDNGEVKITGKWRCSIGKKLEISKLKSASKMWQCSLIHVILAGITVGYEKYFEKYHVTKQRGLPENIHFVFPAPLPKHPDLRLVNHWALSRMEIKFGFSSTKAIIDFLKEETNKAATSVLPLISTLMFRYATPILPTSLVDSMSKTKATCTALLTNVVGPQGDGTICEGRITELMFWMPIVQETSAMSIGIISCNGGIRVCYVADVGCVPDRARLEDFGEMVNEGISHICETAEDM